MKTLISITSTLTIIIFIKTSILTHVKNNFSNKKQNLDFLVNILEGLGIFIYTLSLILHVYLHQNLPLGNFYETLLFLAWGLMLFYIFIKSKLQTELFNFLPLLIAFILTVSTVFPNKAVTTLAPDLQNSWLYPHIFMASIAFPAFILAFLTSLPLLMKSLQSDCKNKITLLNSKRNSKILTQLSYDFIKLGMSFLTLFIITGTIWAQDKWSNLWFETAALLTWFIYAGYFFLSFIKDWQEKSLIFIKILVFISATLSFIGFNLFL